MPKKPKGEGNIGRCATAKLRLTAPVSVAATLILVLSRLAAATTINASSASQSDVAAAIASATNGDTVTIPGGTATWTRTLQVSKAIKLQGAGVGVTIIKDAVQKGRLISWTLAAGHLSRLTGIEFQDGGRVNIGAAPGGILHVNGSNTNGSQFRWDHCKWNDLNGYPVLNTVIGVIDHCTFIVTGKQRQAMNFYGSGWNDQGPYGDGSWAARINYGSSQFTFVEDCEIICNVNFLFNATDAFAGARFVIRHNHIHNLAVGNHGTESTGRERGARAMEVYNNTYTGTNANSPVGGTRSGGVLFHDNNISGYWGNNAMFTLTNYRNVYPFVMWGGVDGTNAWDVNEPNAFFSGTAASASSCPGNSCSVTVSGANFTPNQWAGYTLRRTSGFGVPNFGWIRGNTSNTITYAYGGFGNMLFSAGDSLEMRKVIHALDQPGRGQGSLISGANPTPPPGWNNQVTEPCYSWNNITELGGHVNFVLTFGSIRVGEHYFNDTPMPGYMPYVYPHPLVSGQPMPTLLGSPPLATAKPPTTTTPGFTHGFRIKKKQNAKTAKSKKIPGRPD